jgi:hypothetical protein
MFLETRMIKGINTMRVMTIAINAVVRVVFNIKNEITKAGTAKAIPTP